MNLLSDIQSITGISDIVDDDSLHYYHLLDSGCHLVTGSGPEKWRNTNPLIS